MHSKAIYFHDSLRLPQMFSMLLAVYIPQQPSLHFWRVCSLKNLWPYIGLGFFNSPCTKCLGTFSCYIKKLYTIPPTGFALKCFAWGFCPFNTHTTSCSLSQELLEITTESLAGRNAAFMCPNSFQLTLKSIIPLIPFKWATNHN